MRSALNLIDRLHDENMSNIFDIVRKFKFDDFDCWNSSEVNEKVSQTKKKYLADKYIPQLSKIDPESLSKAPQDIQEAIRWIVKLIVEFLFGPDPYEACTLEQTDDADDRMSHDDLIRRLHAILDTDRSPSSPKP